MKILLTISIILILSGCTDREGIIKYNLSNENREVYTIGSGQDQLNFEIIPIRGHEQLIWKNGYGSQMIHFAGCKGRHNF